MIAERPTLWSRLALLIILVWTLLPVYWFLKNAFLTPDEIARFPPPLYPLEPTPAAFFNIFGFDHTLADGTVRRGSGQANQIIRGLDQQHDRVSGRHHHYPSRRFAAVLRVRAPRLPT